MIAKIGSFFQKMTLLILVLRAYGSRLSVAVRLYFPIVIILADQYHVIRLLIYIELLLNPNTVTCIYRKTPQKRQTDRHTYIPLIIHFPFLVVELSES